MWRALLMILVVRLCYVQIGSSVNMPCFKSGAVDYAAHFALLFVLWLSKKGSLHNNGRQNMRAQFVVCKDCGKHGCIVTAKGERTAEVCAQHEGLEVLARLVGCGEVRDEEIADVMLEIGQTAMPLERSDADSKIIQKVLDINAKRVFECMVPVIMFKRLTAKGDGTMH
jgi:hypothetical protein